MTEDLDGDLAWAEAVLREHAAAPVSMERVVALPARTGRLHRLDVVVLARRQRYFLKRYTPAAVSGWDEHAAHLRLIAAAIGAESGLLAYALAGVNTARQLTLAAEVPGVRLTRGSDQVEVWHGVGRWLARLHGLTPRPSAPAVVADIVAYIEPRLRQWMERDPRRADTARRAIASVASLPPLFTATPAVALCHGDINAANIRVHGSDVGLIDFDDARVDMPGIDLSQAELEIDELSRGWLMAPRGANRARAALRAGYGAAYVEGPALWLPHLRNLAVFLTTLAGQRQRGPLERLAHGPRYHRTIGELERTIDTVESACRRG